MDDLEQTPRPSPARSIGFIASAARYVVPLCIVVLFGALNLYYPLSGDQALFLIGAKALDNGAALYVDFWDLKQPAIFLFHWLAGRLFGFTEFGVHLLELIWMCGLTVALIRLLKDYFDTGWLASLAPLTTVGIYYLGTGVWHMTQVEILIAFPTVLCIWIGQVELRNPRKEWAAFFLAGLCVAAVAMLKLVLVALPGMALMVSMGLTLFRRQRTSSDVLQWQVVPAAAGAALGLSCVFLWLWSQGSLAMFFWTTFSYPVEIMSEWRTWQPVPNKGAAHLISAAKWFSYLYLPWTPFIAIAIYDFIRVRRDPLTAQFMVWLAMGAAVLLIQTISWWAYHYLLFFVPAGVLALRGVDIMYVRLTQGAGRTAGLSILTAIVLIFPAFGTSLLPGLDKLKAAAGTTRKSEGNWVKEYQIEVSDKHRVVMEETEHLLEPSALPGPIYVFGDPNFYVYGKREQAIAVHGWGWRIWLESQWAALPGDLSTAQPVYIFVASYYADLIRQRSPATVELIDRSYEMIRESPAGIWYRLAS